MFISYSPNKINIILPHPDACNCIKSVQALTQIPRESASSMPRRNTRLTTNSPCRSIISKYFLRQRIKPSPVIPAVTLTKTKSPRKTKRIKKQVKKSSSKKVLAMEKKNSNKKSAAKRKNRKTATKRIKLEAEARIISKSNKVSIEQVNIGKKKRELMRGKISRQTEKRNRDSLKSAIKATSKPERSSLLQNSDRRSTKTKSKKKLYSTPKRRDTKTKKADSSFPKIKILTPPFKKEHLTTLISRCNPGTASRRTKVITPLDATNSRQADSPMIIKEEDPIHDIIVTDNRGGEGNQRDSSTKYKSIDELQRIKRGREQRIYLLSAEKEANQEWKFKVFGTRGQVYTTRLHMTVRCSCFDFRSNKKPCKHIYFIILQIAQNEKILEAFNEGQISEDAFTQLDLSLTSRLRARMEGEHAGEQKTIDLNDDKDCVICFTEMNQKEEVLNNCEVCKKYFHGECLRKWRNLNDTCPLCRSEFKLKEENDADPLAKFEDLRI